MSLACKVREPKHVGHRCDPPNDTFTSVRELTNHLYGVHHVSGAEATIEARRAAAETYPGRDLKAHELTAATSLTSRKTAPKTSSLPAPRVSEHVPSGPNSERKCGGCGRPGTRRDFCPVCNPDRAPAPKPTPNAAPARADVTRPSESPTRTSADGSRVTSVTPPPSVELSRTSLSKASPALPPIVPEDKALVHKRLNHLDALLRQAIGVIDSAQGIINELRAGLTR